MKYRLVDLDTWSAGGQAGADEMGSLYIISITQWRTHPWGFAIKSLQFTGQVPLSHFHFRKCLPETASRPYGSDANSPANRILIFATPVAQSLELIKNLQRLDLCQKRANCCLFVLWHRYKVRKGHFIFYEKKNSLGNYYVWVNCGIHGRRLITAETDTTQLLKSAGWYRSTGISDIIRKKRLEARKLSNAHWILQVYFFR